MATTAEAKHNDFELQGSSVSSRHQTPARPRTGNAKLGDKGQQQRPGKLVRECVSECVGDNVHVDFLTSHVRDSDDAHPTSRFL